MIIDDVEAAVRAVPDPELRGLGIGDLGLVDNVTIDDRGTASVTLLPTFLGCPALTLIASDVVSAVVAAGADTCAVTWAHEPRWSADRITEIGVAHLALLGIAVATNAVHEPPCPTCGTPLLKSISPVGAPACRAVSWCGGCRSVIDVLGGSRVASYAHV